MTGTSHQEESLLVSSLSSFLSGSFSRLVCHPMDTIKAKIQVNKSNNTT